MNNFDTSEEERKRQLYVAITRVKINLAINYNGSYLQNPVAGELTYTIDSSIYSVPQTMSYFLTHKDVQLRYFEFVQGRMNGLVSGDPLIVRPEGLAKGKGLVVKFSAAFCKVLEGMADKGYKLANAKVNFIVWWGDAKEGREVKVVLPELGFSKLKQLDYANLKNNIL